MNEQKPATVMIILLTAMLIVLETSARMLVSVLVPLIARAYVIGKRWYLYNPALDSYYSQIKSFQN